MNIVKSYHIVSIVSTLVIVHPLVKMAHSQYSSAPQYAALVNRYDDLLTTVQANSVAVLVNLAHALKA